MAKQSKSVTLPKWAISFSTPTSRYILILKPASFASAEAKARKYGGYLAELSTASENRQVFEAITGFFAPSSYSKSTADDGGGSSYVWIGGSDAASEGAWSWLKSRTSIPVDGLEWGNGSLGNEPDNFGGNQDYLALGLQNWPYDVADGKGYGNAGMWNDLQGSNKLFCLVEF